MDGAIAVEEGRDGFDVIMIPMGENGNLGGMWQKKKERGVGGRLMYCYVLFRCACKNQFSIFLQKLVLLALLSICILFYVTMRACTTIA